MAGVSIHEKVSRILNKQNGRPVIKPNRPLVLLDTVANRKPRKGEATCVSEMTFLMACWKLNKFADGFCSEETKTFYACMEKAKLEMKNKSQPLHGGRLHPKQANTLLRRYPNLTTEI
ncbi:Hypothetical predicted protein [Xyrichtys novacula]|uniref:Coiled-coil-helix-coiled-coil-helix domain-containing protein 1 n=1 Tax=Xyrichtys novacula TaxID=13765 RepID=A0AAV1FZ30_XYRNO|nr:Hypothetical predicted protein [Xyrichtys novacula]